MQWRCEGVVGFQTPKSSHQVNVLHRSLPLFSSMVRKKNLCVQTLERFSYVLLFWQHFEYPMVAPDILYLYRCVVGYRVDLCFGRYFI